MSVVRDLRKRLGITQDQLADLVEANTGTISRNEGKDPVGWSAVPFYAVAKERGFYEIAARLRALCQTGIPKCVWSMFEDHPALVPGKRPSLQEIAHPKHPQEHAMLEEILEHGEPEEGVIVDVLKGSVKRIKKQKAERGA